MTPEKRENAINNVIVPEIGEMLTRIRDRLKINAAAMPLDEINTLHGVILRQIHRDIDATQ